MPKRAETAASDTSNKLPKLEHTLTPAVFSTPQQQTITDFSHSVKKKLQSSSRTGQACDRCKVRKIRCDDKPGGCSPCEQNNTVCETTDRITRVPIRRGHVEGLEAELAFARAQIADLQAQLRELGVEPRTVSSYNSNNALQPSNSWLPPHAAPASSDWAHEQRQSPAGYAPASGVETTEYRPLPEFKPASIGDNYVGVSSADSLLSHIKGTSLSIFGTELDITDYLEESDADYDNSELSYNHFLRVILGEDKTVEFVPYHDYPTLHTNATWYIRSMNPYTMLLDKPTFMRLIWRIGNDGTYHPTPAETVCVHMMLATLKYQIASRNGESHLMRESHKHYRYSLSFFKDLLHGHTLQDVQALAMVCQHVRNFPKPGAAWLLTSTTFNLAIELGLHRSTKAWSGSSKLDTLEIELRKRIFWTLHALASNLSGKLGRPMPIAIEDVDVEYPEPVDDCLPDEQRPPDAFHRCSFQVGIHTAKYTALSAEMYRSVYAVKQSSRGYEDAVRRLERKIRQWRSETPAELREPLRATKEDRIFALYLEFWHLEFLLLLHHPAVCRSTNPDFISSGLDQALMASQRMLHNCTQIAELQSLDMPWINTVVYIAAIFTTLFIYTQRKDLITMADMGKLREDMDKWLVIIAECGRLLRTGDKLKNAVAKIVVSSLETINQSIVKRTATETLASIQSASTQGQEPVFGTGGSYAQYPVANGSSTEYAALATSSAPFASIPTSTSLSYGTVVPGAEQTSSAFDQQAYNANEDAAMSASHAAALVAAATPNASAQRTNGSFSYPSIQTPSNASSTNYQLPYNAAIGSHWQQWSQATAATVQRPGDYLNSANTLLPLGSRRGSAQNAGPNVTTSVGLGDGTVLTAATSTTPALNYAVDKWPAVMFPNYPMGPLGHGGQGQSQQPQ